MDVTNLIITLVSGVIGGNMAGASMRDKDLGTLGNTVAGFLGGGFGDFILKALGMLASTGAATAAGTGSELDLGSILASIGVGGLSGGGMTAIIAFIKNAIQNNTKT